MDFLFVNKIIKNNSSIKSADRSKKLTILKLPNNSETFQRR